jgi:hypothetical protein
MAGAGDCFFGTSATIASVVMSKPAISPQTGIPPPAAPPRPSARPPGLAPGFGSYMQTVANGVHSGSGRTALNDNNTDYYPVPLKQDTLRPGTVYADPYGHILMIVRRVPQSRAAAGVILAVDGQPDGTVARKRFWRGNFLFAQDLRSGGPGSSVSGRSCATETALCGA